MGVKTKQRYVIQYQDGSYYTVFGWSASTTKHIGSAVAFPNVRMRVPDHVAGQRRVKVIVGHTGMPELPK